MKKNYEDNWDNDINNIKSPQKENKYPARLGKEQAEDEAVLLRSMVDSGFSPDYESADEMLGSNQLLEDTDQNAFFWRTVIDLRDKYINDYQANWLEEHRDELHESYHHCFACHKELKPVWPDVFHFNKKCTQYEDALIIDIDGGYGMFIDPILIDDMEPKEILYNGLIENEYSAIICQDCAHDLCKQIPWMDRFINPDYYEERDAKYENFNGNPE